MPGPTFRIFVSSTFADLSPEREALRTQVFPRLRTLARSHDARFQAVDLRWGVSQDAAYDQRTVAICLEEVDRCLQADGPPMIVLLGDRYGWCPLPDRIPAETYEAIRHDELNRWYRRDDNAVPPEYRLQPRDPAETPDDEWTRIERRLRDILAGGARAAELPEAERRRLTASATELEILRTAFDRDDVHCYFRSIDGLPLEGTGFGEPDEHARAALERVKRELTERHPTRVRRYTARWTADGPTLDHLPQLCEDVFADLSAAMRARLSAQRATEPDEHAAFGRARARVFVGRQAELDRLGAYIANPDGVPLAIVGPSGCGKSALIARAVDELPAAMVSAIRFIGATATSTTAGGLLDSICREIARVYGEDEGAVPTGYRELAEEFGRLLALATAERPLLVAVDALDQFGADDPGRDLAWLPLELPAHAALVVSSTSAVPAASALELEPMSQTDGEALLDRWLNAGGRTLQDSQREPVLATFRRTGLPLHLRLLAEEARRWPSYAETPPLAADVTGVMRGLFARLATPAEHGEDLVRRSLGYLAAAKHGLSEDELLEVLATDTGAMASFRQRFPRSPPADELPTIIWSRLYSDLAPYLVERSGDGVALLGFLHRQLREVTEEQFLGGDERLERHRLLARYFRDQPLDFEGHANLRRLSEQPYHETLGNLWDDAFETLTNFAFLERKVADAAVEEHTDQEGRVTRRHGGVYLLQEDYRRALRLWPR